jgi:hypothetical protein
MIGKKGAHTCDAGLQLGYVGQTTKTKLLGDTRRHETLLPRPGDSSVVHQVVERLFQSACIP